MVIPDVNLLIYAYNEVAPHHRAARKWWEDLLSSEQPVALPWAVVFGFVRLVTHSRVLEQPIRPGVALDHIESWLARPAVQVLDPGPRHLLVCRTLLDATGVAAGLTSDTHLAALAIEHQCELHSNDSDFARVPGLRWRNPLES